MNKFFEIFKSLFGLTEEQVEKAKEELKNMELSENDKAKTLKTQENEKEKSKNIENVETTKKTEDLEKNSSVSVEDKSAVATSNTVEGVEETVRKEEYEELKKQFEEVKTLLETTQNERKAEQRTNKIKSVKGCVDYGVLTTLLDGVEDKDLDSRIEEIKAEKGYLFGEIKTEGFNPATPQNTMNGVEAAFYELNPNLMQQ